MNVHAQADLFPAKAKHVAHLSDGGQCEVERFEALLDVMVAQTEAHGADSNESDDAYWNVLRFPTLTEAGRIRKAEWLQFAFGSKDAWIDHGEALLLIDSLIEAAGLDLDLGGDE